ncbi:hypothetical protein LTS18_006713 [Coniosporium uncinatum]|uniref:Uncharacterized protein n=1 Tax=Coniosporium uncinatum TaxID=93489 RepID=A0ACC3D3C7_9PEZI|nr:hypothetical protein LTS18_006713 [Coniosporium uncinatum]
MGFAGVKRRLRALEAWIEKWNREAGAKEGVSIIPLRRTGYLTLDIQIPDPQIGFDLDPSSVHLTTAPATPATSHAPSSNPTGFGGGPRDEIPPLPVKDLAELRKEGQERLPLPQPQPQPPPRAVVS